MNVILDSIDDVQLSAELSHDSAEVGKEPRFKRGVDEGPGAPRVRRRARPRAAAAAAGVERRARLARLEKHLLRLRRRLLWLLLRLRPVRLVALRAAVRVVLQLAVALPAVGRRRIDRAGCKLLACSMPAAGLR